MNEYSRNIIGNNVRQVRLLLGLSQLNFSILTGVSKASIINIESGKNGYNLNLLDGIIKFLDCTLSELSSNKFSPKQNIRERLIEKYKNQPEYFNILSKDPEIVYAINYRLLRGDFLQEPKEIKEIRNEIFTKYGWLYKSSSISNALTRMTNSILIEWHAKKKKTHIYSKKANQ